MLIMAYPRVDLFEPLQGFTDIYIDRVDLAMDPLLSALDQVLADETLMLLVWNAYVTRRPQCLTTGRRSTPVEVLIRLQAVRRLYAWSYRQVQRQVKGSLVLRQFTRVYGHTVPSYATMQDWENALPATTVRLINQRVVALAEQYGATEGKRLRTDGTVTETNIHYPTDSSLLEDSVRVLGRMLSAGRELVGQQADVPKQLFVNHTRSVKRLARAIGRAAGKKRAKEAAHVRKMYRKLLKTTQETLDHAQQVIPVVKRYGGLAGQGLADSLTHYLPLVARVIDQAQRRIMQGESVPAAEKLVSLFEPHTAIIKRGKPAPRDTEFGRKIMLDEVDGGIISDYRILSGNPPEDRQFQASLDNHQQLFQHPPDLVATDRGIASPANEAAAQQAGVKQISLPESGHLTAERRTHERQKWFRLGQRFRAGAEGRISVLKRARQLDRCLDKGETGFEKWIGWGCIVNNLVRIAQSILKPRRKRAAARTA